MLLLSMAIFITVQQPYDLRLTYILSFWKTEMPLRVRANNKATYNQIICLVNMKLFKSVETMGYRLQSIKTLHLKIQEPRYTGQIRLSIVYVMTGGLFWTMIYAVYYMFFCIPANTIPQQQVRLRNDNQNLMDIQIQYDDPSFKDTRSSIRFKPWLRMKIPYSNLLNGNQRQDKP